MEHHTVTSRDAGVGEMLGGGIGPAAALQIGEDPVAALLVQRLEMLAEAIFVIHSNPRAVRALEPTFPLIVL